jgi:hypothetical protein
LIASLLIFNVPVGSAECGFSHLMIHILSEDYLFLIF